MILTAYSEFRRQNDIIVLLVLASLDSNFKRRVQNIVSWEVIVADIWTILKNWLSQASAMFVPFDESLVRDYFLESQIVNWYSLYDSFQLII